MPVQSSNTSLHPTLPTRDFVEHSTNKLLFVKETSRALGELFYAVPERRVADFQADQTLSLSFTQEGLNGLRARHDRVKGAPPFIYSILSRDFSHQEARQLVQTPHFYPYFSNENFLVVPNIKYDPSCNFARQPKAQKWTVNGLKLCAWFLHPHLKGMDDQAVGFLKELAGENPQSMPILSELQSQLEAMSEAKANEEKSLSGKMGNVAPHSKIDKRDNRTIGEIREHGEYLASILDLKSEHVQMLKGLRENAIRHLESQYGICEHDKIDLFFHFPYPESTTTLHMHIRVNEGRHPLDRANSFTVDELIGWLSSNRSIDELVLARQDQNFGRFYYDERELSDQFLSDFGDIPGLKIRQEDLNVHALRCSEAQIPKIYARDDGRILRPKAPSLKRASSLTDLSTEANASSVAKLLGSERAEYLNQQFGELKFILKDEIKERELDSDGHVLAHRDRIVFSEKGVTLKPFQLALEQLEAGQYIWCVGRMGSLIVADEREKIFVLQNGLERLTQLGHPGLTTGGPARLAGELRVQAVFLSDGSEKKEIILNIQSGRVSAKGGHSFSALQKVADVLETHTGKAWRQQGGSIRLDYTDVLDPSEIAEMAVVESSGFGARFCAALLDRNSETVRVKFSDLSTTQQFEFLEVMESLPTLNAQRTTVQPLRLDALHADLSALGAELNHTLLSRVFEVIRNLNQSGQRVVIEMNLQRNRLNSKLMDVLCAELERPNKIARLTFSKVGCAQEQMKALQKASNDPRTKLVFL